MNDPVPGPAPAWLPTMAAAALALFACGPPCPTIRHDDAERALRYHRSMRAPALSVRAEARVEQWGREGRIRGTVMMFLQRPDRVRFDAMTQFGPAAILTSDGREFALTDLRENRYLTGPTCPENIARLLGIPLSGEDVARILLGDTPRIEATEREISCRRGEYRISLRAVDGTRQEIVLATREADREQPLLGQRLRLRRSEVFGPSGERQWRATYDDYRVIEDPRSEERPRLGVAMPFVVRFEDFRQRADTTVRFKTIDLNVDVPAEAFRQEPRPGIETEMVLCE